MAPAAWEIVIPASTATPELTTHEGDEWLSVLSGRLRVVIGAHDVVLGVGEVAELDTRVPHWFGSTGEQPRRAPGPEQPDRAGWLGAPAAASHPS